MEVLLPSGVKHSKHFASRGAEVMAYDTMLPGYLEAEKRMPRQGNLELSGSLKLSAGKWHSQISLLRMSTRVNLSG